MELTNALVMVMAIFMSGIYAGSVTGITVNIPGAASGAITTMEGHVMMKRGHGAQALSLDALASSIGGVIGALVLMFVAVPMSEFALMFHTPDKFALVFMAVVTVVIVAKGSIWKSLIAVTLGLMISTVGFDNMVAQGRFDFGSANLIEGVQLLPAVIGLFAVCELLLQGGASLQGKLDTPEFKVRHRDFWPDWGMVREIGVLTYLKSSVIGVLIGMLPGGGAAMASFVAYAEAKRVSKKPEEYGNGSHEGLAAAESANNAMCGGAVVPLLTLGIPGDTVTAILIGAFLIQGIEVGPLFIATNASLFLQILMLLLLGNIGIVALGFGLRRWLPLLLKVPQRILVPMIAVFCAAGGFSISNMNFDVTLIFVLGLSGFVLMRLGLPMAPVVLGLVLGPIVERNMRDALTVNQMDFSVFATRPISAFFLVATVAVVGWSIHTHRRAARRGDQAGMA